MTIAVDFDGTIVEHKYPGIGREKPFAIDTLKQLKEDGHRLILWTSREGELLSDAVRYCQDRGLVFYAVNSNQPLGGLFEKKESGSSKVIADIYIDDRNLGGIPDWGTIYYQISGLREKAHQKHLPWWKRLKKHFSA